MVARAMLARHSTLITSFKRVIKMLLRGILILFLLCVSVTRSASVASTDERQEIGLTSSSLDSPALLDTVRYMLAEIEHLKSSTGHQEKKIIEQKKKLADQAKEIAYLSAAERKATSPERSQHNEIPRKRRSSSDDNLDSPFIIFENAEGSGTAPFSSGDEEGVSQDQATDDALEKRITELMQQLIDAAEKRFKQDFEAFKYEIKADELSKFSQNSAMETTESAVEAVNDERDEMLRKQLASQAEEKFQQLQAELEDDVDWKILAGFEKWEELHRMTSTNLARSCSELMEFNPTLASGTYIIDPDGWNTGDPPIQVRCEKSGDTIVVHDSMEKTTVEQCFEAGCYSRRINYSATLRQLRALTQLSSTCSQTIRYDCYVAPIAFCDVNYAWWRDVRGNPQYYWTGSSSTSNGSSNHTCSCGLTRTCFDPKLNCNCDATAATSLFDEGTLNNKDHLPVTRLHFGRLLSSNSSGEHTLGPLRCSGASSDNNNEKPASSCADLWRSGQLSTGLYHVQRENETMIRTLYCDMSKLPDDMGFESLIGHIDIKAPDVVHYSSMVPDSCADLRLAGQSTSGLYQVYTDYGKSQKISTVFCDMSKDIDDKGFETFIGFNDVKSALVHFSVARTSGIDKSNVITYDHVWLNLGDAMDINSGVFTAPKAGIYSFTLNFVGNLPSTYGWGFIRRNGDKVVGSRITKGDDHGIKSSAASAHVTIRLKAGDRVDTYNDESNLFSDYDHKSINFSGSLLDEL